MKKQLPYLILLFITWSFFINSAGVLKAQIIIDENINASRILNQLVGEGVTISNVTINCPGDRVQGLSYARFVSNSPDFPLDSGIVLTTGKARDALGVNVSDQTTTNWGAAGNAALTNIAGIPTFDACVITFDVVPIGNQLRFKYTFASEEYEEFTPCAGQNINDVFAFLISGPNPTGGNYNNRNIAIIPNTTLPVSINTINQCTNTQYYANNNGGQEIEYDGYTLGLFAQIDVQPCATYTLSLRIADGADGLWDSAVFIEEITSQIPQLAYSVNSLTGILIPSCTEGSIVINREQANRAETFKLDFQGEAIPGIDFTLSSGGIPVTSYPTNVVFGINETQKILTINSLNNQESSSTTLYLKTICGENTIDTLQIIIQSQDDIIPIPDYPEGVVYRCNSSEVIEIEARPADGYAWSSDNGSFTCLDTECKRIRAEFSDNLSTFNLTIRIGDCEFDQIIEVIPSVLTFADDQTTICVGASTILEASGRDTYTWTPTTGLSCANCPNPVASPTQSTIYTVTGTRGTCTSSETINVIVIQEVGPEILNLVDGYCVDANPFELQGNPSGGQFQLQGNGIDLQNITQIAPSSLPVGIYELTYTLGTGAGCSEQTVRALQIYALPNAPQIIGLATEYCINDANVVLQGNPSNSTSFFTLNGNALTSLSPATLGVGQHEVFYTYTDENGCSNTTSQGVEVKALPQLVFEGLANGYCIAENNVPVRVNIIEPNGQTRTEIVETLQLSEIGIGSYTVRFAYQSPNGCSNEISQNIRIYPQPILNFTNLDPEYCDASLPFSLTANPTGGIFSVNGTETSTFDPTLFEPNDTPTISYFFVDANGCSKVITETVLITASSIDSNNPESFVLTICPRQFVGFDLEAISEDDTQEGYTYLWQPGGETTRTLNISRREQEGNYLVITRDAENCPVAYRSFNVSVNCEPVVLIPTAFSPNNDQLNDRLEILGQDFANLDFKVYDRWGTLIFESFTQENTWNGSISGREAPTGVYIWTATYINVLTNETFKKQGKVTLIR